MNQILLDKGFTSNAGAYTRHESLVIAAVKMLMPAGLKAMGQTPRSKKVTIEEDGSVKLPGNYAHWIAVGELFGDRILTFNYDPSLTHWKTYGKCGAPQENKAKTGLVTVGNYYSSGYLGTDAWGSARVIQGNGYIGTIFGLPGGNNMPGFNEDWENKRLQVSSRANKGKTILLHYWPDTKGVNGMTEILITQVLFEAICSYVEAKLHMAVARTFNQGMAFMQNFKEYRTQWNRQNWKNKWTPQTVANAFNRAANFTPK